MKLKSPVFKTQHQISVVLADDHPLVLHGLADMLGAEPDVRVLSLCHDGAAAVQAVEALHPDVAVIDMAMPKLDGLGVLQTVGSTRTKFILLTASTSPEQMRLALAKGAAGILFKDSTAEKLTACVRSVAAGQLWLIAAPREPMQPRPEASLGDAAARPLSAREREVAKLVSWGFSNKEIGRLLTLSEGTVKVHLHNIYGKVGVSNRTALAALSSNAELAHS